MDGRVAAQQSQCQLCRAVEQHNLPYQTLWTEKKAPPLDGRDAELQAFGRALLRVLPEVGEDLLEGVDEVVLVDLALAEGQR